MCDDKIISTISDSTHRLLTLQQMDCKRVMDQMPFIVTHILPMYKNNIFHHRNKLDDNQIISNYHVLIILHNINKTPYNMGTVEKRPIVGICVESMCVLDASRRGNMQLNGLIIWSRYVLIPRFFNKPTITPHLWDGSLSSLFSLGLCILQYTFAEGITRGMRIVCAMMMFSSSFPYHKNLFSYPWKTRTPGQGQGFEGIGLRVGDFYPQKTPVIHQLRLGQITVNLWLCNWTFKHYCTITTVCPRGVTCDTKCPLSQRFQSPCDL